MKINKNKMLLIIIYIAFISLGLPDTVLGVAWPGIRETFAMPLKAAGILAFITTLGTVISSFCSGRVLERFGTAKVVTYSIALTGIALLGYSVSNSFLWLMLCTIPLGIGAGAVDTGINNYVAINYTQRDMNWLHCFWGVGAFIGPNLISMSIMYMNGWRGGYRIIGIIQMTIGLIVLLTMKLWDRKETEECKEEEHEEEKLSGFGLLAKKGVLLSILVFPIYVSTEMIMGVWFGSYLVESRGFMEVKAGVVVSLFYATITIGRFIAGSLSKKYSSEKLMRCGLIIMLVGAALINIPFKACTILGVMILGIGCAPIFPGMLHNTPALFGKKNSQEITGYQIGCSYLSGVVIIPLVGFVAESISMRIIPIALLVFTLIIIIILKTMKKIMEQ